MMLDHTGRRRWARFTGAAAAALLAACGGGGGSGGSGNTPGTPGEPSAPPPETAMGDADAARLLAQGGWGPTEDELRQAAALSPSQWLSAQFALPASRYPDYSDAIHTTPVRDYCAEVSRSPTCFRDLYSAEPLSRAFYQQAVAGTDVLRQRVAWALSQLWVVSSLEVQGTYGMRDYQQMLRDGAFGNLRTLLGTVARHPVMGEFLNMVDNDKAAPNENFARELLQLFTIGPCALEADGRLRGGACQPTYDNAVVRDVAFALTGWTYPTGGRSYYSRPDGQSPRYLKGEMAPVPARHDGEARRLPGGGTLPAGLDPRQALDTVLDSLFRHPNFAPFIGTQLIQRLVTSNPSPAYVARVGAAIERGTAHGIGSGQRGDMRATLAAILLDTEARDPTLSAARDYGRVREPVQFFIHVMRAAQAKTDGIPFFYWLGGATGQSPFAPPSVFNYFPAEHPLPGTALRAPEAALASEAAMMMRMNFGHHLFYGNGGQGFALDPARPGATGTITDLAAFESSAADPDALVTRLDRLMTGGRLDATARGAIAGAVAAWDAERYPDTFRAERVRTAFYLFSLAPDVQVQR